MNGTAQLLRDVAVSSFSTASLPFSRALCHHPLPCPWAAGLVRADHRLFGARLRRPAPQHPLVPGGRTRTRLLAPGAPPPAAGPLEAVRNPPCDPLNPHKPGAAPDFLKPGWASCPGDSRRYWDVLRAAAEAGGGAGEVLAQLGDVCVLRLLEALLQTLPHLLLQAYVVVAVDPAGFIPGEFPGGWFRL